MLVKATSTSGCGDLGIETLAGSVYSWLGWMGALSYHHLSKRHRHPDEKSESKQELQDLKERGLSEE